MATFSWISVMLSLVLGLGITRLLSSAVALFRSRGRIQTDWIPLVWAACIFLWQLQFWWAIIELSPRIMVWTPLQFLALLSLPLMLFVAAALVLPHTEMESGSSLTSSFKRDGRWALLFLAAYFFSATGANWYFWNVSPLNCRGGINLALTALPLIFLSVSSRKLEGVLTILNFVLSLFAAWTESPHAY